MSAVEEIRKQHFPESGNSTYAFCHKCGKPYPCLPIRALDEMQDAIDSFHDETQTRLVVTAMDQAVEEVVQQLAMVQGRLFACEEIIARTRLLAASYVRPSMTYAGTPLAEGSVPVSQIFAALGPEPDPGDG